MYRALQSAQNDVHTTLLKFADEIIQVVESKTSNGKPEGCCGSAPDGGETLQSLSSAIQLLHAKQDVQYRVLTGAIHTLNETLSRLGASAEKTQSAAAVQTATVIPSIQLAASSNDMKDVVFTSDVNVSVIDNAEEVEVDAEEAEVEEAEVDAEEAEVEEAEVEEEAEVDAEEAEVEVEVEEEVEVEVEEEGIEVEEWTYKGRLFFKDSDNKVYVNDNGEIGDAIGLYDPVKNLLKKMPVN
jgi:hypothetical protein